MNKKETLSKIKLKFTLAINKIIKLIFKTKNLVIILIIIFLINISNSNAQTPLPRKYPSIRLGLVLPGGSSAPLDQEAIKWLMSLYGAAGAREVTRFEADHFDFSAGSGDFWKYGYNDRIIATTYVYFQILYGEQRRDQSGIWKYALSQGWDPEDFFLHYKEDTYTDIKSISGNAHRGYFFHLGNFRANGTPMPLSTYYPDSKYALAISTSVPYSRDGLYLFHMDKFFEVRVVLDQPAQLTQNSELVIEYPSAVDSNYRVTQWSRLPSNAIEVDTTNMFTQNGTIRFKPPADWKRVDAKESGLILGSAGIDGGASLLYVMRIGLRNWASPPVLSLVWSGQPPVVRTAPCVSLETTSLRTGPVISATSNSITINNNNLYRGGNYYKDMTIEIVSGVGAGQVRTITGSDANSNPRLYVSPNWDTIPNNTSIYRITGPTGKIVGYDPANDRNGDGYVDDSEFANLANSNATARMRWMSRVTKGGEAWAEFQSVCRPNLWNPNYRQALLAHWIPSMHSMGLRAYYNDDAPALLQYQHFPVLHGGYIWERQGGPVGRDHQMNLDYRNAFLDIHKAFRNNGVEWVSTNIANSNYWDDNFLRPYIGEFNQFLCEDTVWDGVSYAWTGLSIARKAWQLSGYARFGVTLLIMGQKNRFGGVINDWGGTREAWEYATLSQLAQYYLIQIPDKMIFNFWNSTFWYGSRLTEQSTGSGWYAYWKSGVPTNMAYPPFKVLQVDIGEPSNRIPGNYEPLHYLEGFGSFVVVGRSTDNHVILPKNNNLRVDVYPTYIFYLWKSSNLYSGVPFEAVLAREYTKGLVLYRAPAGPLPTGMNRIQYTSTENAITVRLPGTYKRINYDGTLGQPINEISIRGYEGIILVKDDQNIRPSPKISITVDKVNSRENQHVKTNIQIADREGLYHLERSLNLENILISKGSLKINNFLLSDFISNLIQVISNFLNLNIPVSINLETIRK